MEMKGIDVSGYQGVIDFNKVKASGKQFVIIKAGYSTSTVDTFETNYKNAKTAGLHVGAYWYSYAETLADGKAEAQAFIKAVKGKQFDFPLYMDLEESSQFKKGKKFCSDLVTTFCSELENAGLFAGLYCSTSPLETYITEDVRKKYVIWCADYRGKCYYKGDYGIWQSGTGKVNGIDGDCDIDTGYVDYSTIIINGGFNGYPKKTTVNTANTNTTNTSTTAKKVKFTPRTTAPSATDKHWISTTKGGLNICIVISGGSVLPNCVGYAWGRFYEIIGEKPTLASINAENWYPNTADGYKRSDTPKVGAIACWRKGQVYNGNDGCGHVAIVERVEANGDIFTSNSAYGGTRFYTQTYKKSNGYNSGSLVFQGFILPPVELEVDNTTTAATSTTASGASTNTTNTNTASNTTLKVGDIVDFTGDTHYGSSTAVNGTKCTAGKAKITIIAKGAKHPYHLVNCGNGSSVYGWVNAEDIKTLKTVDEIALEVIRGDWGNGDERKKRLTEAGYNYSDVQKIVEKLMK
ncbi:MAG: CHAP domain-containing protein [Lachnospiraceae bacterium]|nr:CHAP domain-containing protein [Ruminococcus sp.]MCM1277306.1 CHAP domain-containing protein [Lachnospiraceae bacterium]